MLSNKMIRIRAELNDKTDQFQYSFVPVIQTESLLAIGARWFPIGQWF